MFLLFLGKILKEGNGSNFYGLISALLFFGLAIIAAAAIVRYKRSTTEKKKGDRGYIEVPIIGAEIRRTPKKEETPKKRFFGSKIKLYLAMGFLAGALFVFLILLLILIAG